MEKQKVDFIFEQITGSGKYNRDDAAQLTFQPIGVAALTLNNVLQADKDTPYIEDVKENETAITDYHYQIDPPAATVLIIKKFYV